MVIETTPKEELLQLLENSEAQQKLLAEFPALEESVSYIMAVPGKKFRPLLLLQACDLFNGEALATAVNPALAMELFHNFTLVHDDIMDEADIRRGRPSVHKVYGLNSAIIVGDTLLCHAYQMLGTAPQICLPQALDIFSKAAIGVMEGQHLDLEFEEKDDVTEFEYLHMIENKTSVLLAASLQIGAIIGGATPKDHQLMYDFGKNLGLMFQIKDDLLDAFGSEESFGKKVGGDIVQNKKTYLQITCRNLASQHQKEQLSSAMSLTEEEQKIEKVKALFVETGARAQAEKKMNEFYTLAIKALNQVGVENGRKEQLKELADSIYSRTY